MNLLLFQTSLQACSSTNNALRNAHASMTQNLFQKIQELNPYNVYLSEKNYVFYKDFVCYVCRNLISDVILYQKSDIKNILIIREKSSNYVSQEAIKNYIVEHNNNKNEECFSYSSAMKGVTYCHHCDSIYHTCCYQKAIKISKKYGCVECEAYSQLLFRHFANLIIALERKPMLRKDLKMITYTIHLIEQNDFQTFLFFLCIQICHLNSTQMRLLMNLAPKNQGLMYKNLQLYAQALDVADTTQPALHEIFRENKNNYSKEVIAILLIITSANRGETMSKDEALEFIRIVDENTVIKSKNIKIRIIRNILSILFESKLNLTDLSLEEVEFVLRVSKDYFVHVVFVHLLHEFEHVKSVATKEKMMAYLKEMCTGDYLQTKPCIVLTILYLTKFKMKKFVLTDFVYDKLVMSSDNTVTFFKSLIQKMLLNEYNILVDEPDPKGKIIFIKEKKLSEVPKSVHRMESGAEPAQNVSKSQRAKSECHSSASKDVQTEFSCSLSADSMRLSGSKDDGSSLSLNESSNDDDNNDNSNNSNDSLSPISSLVTNEESKTTTTDNTQLDTSAALEEFLNSPTLELSTDSTAALSSSCEDSTVFYDCEPAVASNKPHLTHKAPGKKKQRPTCKSVQLKQEAIEQEEVLSFIKKVIFADKKLKSRGFELKFLEIEDSVSLLNANSLLCLVKEIRNSSFSVINVLIPLILTRDAVEKFSSFENAFFVFYNELLGSDFLEAMKLFTDLTANELTSIVDIVRSNTHTTSRLLKKLDELFYEQRKLVLELSNEQRNALLHSIAEINCCHAPNNILKHLLSTLFTKELLNNNATVLMFCPNCIRQKHEKNLFNLNTSVASTRLCQIKVEKQHYTYIKCSTTEGSRALTIRNGNNSYLLLYNKENKEFVLLPTTFVDEGNAYEANFENHEALTALHAKSCVFEFIDNNKIIFKLREQVYTARDVLDKEEKISIENCFREKADRSMLFILKENEVVPFDLNK